jgi:16S rRNA U1498 N3-methylase RsmE
VVWEDIALPKESAHYLVNVLRLRVGAIVTQYKQIEIFKAVITQRLRDVDIVLYRHTDREGKKTDMCFRAAKKGPGSNYFVDITICTKIRD